MWRRGPPSPSWWGVGGVRAAKAQVLSESAPPRNLQGEHPRCISGTKHREAFLVGHVADQAHRGYQLSWDLEEQAVFSGDATSYPARAGRRRAPGRGGHPCTSGRCCRQVQAASPSASPEPGAQPLRPAAARLTATCACPAVQAFKSVFHSEPDNLSF